MADISNLPVNASTSTTVDKWAGKSCGTLVDQLKETMQKISNSAIKKKREEAKAVEGDADKKKSGGLWDKMMEEPLKSFREKTASLKDDSDTLAKGEAGFLKQYSDYLDMGIEYMETTGNLVSNVVDTVMDEMGVINQVSESVGLGSLVPSGQDAGCDKTLLVGTVGAVFEVAAGAVGNGLAAVFSAQATVGMGFNAVGDMYAALMSMPASYLSILLTNRKALLEALQTRVDDIVVFAKKLTDEDYPFDHRTFILELYDQLEEAHSNLGQLGSILNAGGRFQDRLWESSEDIVEEVIAQLFGSKADIKFRLSLIKLYGYQRFMELQIKLLNDRQTAFARIAANIGGFKATIDGADFQNLSSPIITMLRCQIGQVMGDMEKTAEVNALFKYIVNERRWGIELSAVYAMMKNTKNLTGNLTKPSTALNAAADLLSDGLSAGGDSLTGGENYSRLTKLLSSFAREIKRKIARNVDSEILEGLAKSINSEIELLKVSTGNLDKILNNFNNSIAAEGAVAMQAVYAVMDVLGEQGLDTLVDAIAEGDLSKLFDANAITGMLEGTARKNISEILQCCSENAGDGDASRRLIKMNKTLADIQKAKALYNKYTLSYAGDALKRITTKTIPGWKNIQKDVGRISRAPCMNKGQSSAGSQLGLTVI